MMQLIGWQGWVVVSGILSGIAQAIGKRQVAHMSAFQSGLLRDGTILLVILGIGVGRGFSDWSDYNWIWILVGLLESVMMAAYYSASREELASTVIFSYPLSSVLIVGFSGLLFGEWQYFDPRAWQGIVNIASLLIIFVLLFRYQGGKLEKTRWSSKIILSSLMVVVSNIVVKLAISNLGVAPENYLLYEYLGLVAGGVAYVVLRKQGMRVGYKSMGWGILQGGLFAASILLLSTVLVDHPLSLVSMLRRVMTVMMTVMLGLLWYKEGRQMSRQQILSLVGAGLVLGVLMFAN